MLFLPKRHRPTAMSKTVNAAERSSVRIQFCYALKRLPARGSISATARASRGAILIPEGKAFAAGTFGLALAASPGEVLMNRRGEDREHWSQVAEEWVAWARKPNHDAFGPIGLRWPHSLVVRTARRWTWVAERGASRVS